MHAVPALRAPRPQRGPEVHHKQSSVDKAMMILGALLELRKPMRLTDLSRRTGLAKSTVHRLLVTLCAHQIIAERDGRYVPIMPLNEPYALIDEDFVNLLRMESSPFLVDLHHITKAQVSVYLRAGVQVLLVNEIHGHQALPTIAHGTEAGATAAELILAAYSDEPGGVNRLSDASISKIRSWGVAYHREKFGEHSMTAIAVPVFNATAFPRPAALTISGQTGSCSVERSAWALRKVGRGLTRRLASCATIPATPA